MKKKINTMLRRCKTISRQLVRSSSYSTLMRSKSSSNNDHHGSELSPAFMLNTNAVSVYMTTGEEDEPHQTVFVGSTRKRYVIASKYLTHPLVNALVQKSTSNDDVSIINCEVVLFDHLLWMLQNSDLNLTPDSLDELANLYLS